VNFKFGVLYARAGQKTDNEMFSNGRNLFVPRNNTCSVVNSLIPACRAQGVNPFHVRWLGLGFGLGLRLELGLANYNIASLNF